MKTHKGARRRTAKQTEHVYGEGSLIKPKGRRHYQLVSYLRGKRVWTSTGCTVLAEARIKAKEIAGDIKLLRTKDGLQKLINRIALMSDDRDLAAAAAPKTLMQLWPAFEADVNRPKCSDRHLKNYRLHLTAFVAWAQKKHPAVKYARDITQSMADSFVAHLRETHSVNTSNKYLNALSLIWRVLKRSCGLDYNPWSKENIIRQRMSQDTQVKRRVLTDEEIAELVRRAEGEMKTLMLIGSETPFRRGDAVSLTWGEVKTESGVIVKTTSKTRARVIVPISGKLDKHLAALVRGEGGAPIMPALSAISDSRLTSRISGHFAACGIERKGKEGIADFHSFRHSWISRMIAKGVNPAFVRRVAGHKSLAMTGHYTHLDEEAIKSAFQGV